MERTRTTALSISMILIMIGMMLLPAAMGAGPNDFTVSVNNAQNTALLSTSTDFGSVTAGTTNDIADSFNLTNTGNLAATINATFTTLRGTTYGLNGTTDVIGGANFSMESTGKGLQVLDNAASNTAFASAHNVNADAAVNEWNVRLVVPAGQTAELYTGTVEIIFGNA